MTRVDLIGHVWGAFAERSVCVASNRSVSRGGAIRFVHHGLGKRLAVEMSGKEESERETVPLPPLGSSVG